MSPRFQYSITGCLPLVFVCLFLQAVPGVAQELPPGNDSRAALLERFEQSLRPEAARSRDPKEIENQILLLSQLGYHDLAGERWEYLATLVPATVEQLCRRAESWILAGPRGVKPAHDALREALELDSNHMGAQFLLARLNHQEGRYVPAEQGYDAVLALEPTHTRAIIGKAALLARRGAVTEAHTLLDGVRAALQDYDPEIRFLLRTALYDFERRGGHLQDTAANHAAYARLLYWAGRIMDATPAARRATQLAPEDYRTWNFMAAMQLQLGNLEPARQAYDRSLEANPDQPEVVETRRQIIQELTTQSGQKLP